jgi:hypothetical protein
LQIEPEKTGGTMPPGRKADAGKIFDLLSLFRGRFLKSGLLLSHPTGGALRVL